ncbi:hypothetical protein KPL70_014094 [Citrus sinensis]|nr:hypothetical protein KPL70_014094 [Citrus sinensis]
MATVDSRLDDLRSQIQGSSNNTGRARNQPHPISSSTEANSSGVEISPVLRSMKMEVPKFDGSDPNGWVFRIEEFFDFHGTPETLRLRIVSFHMEGRAAACASLYEDPQGNLSKLSQTTTVTEFQTAFEDLMNRVTGISEPLLISFFITGLKPDIRRELLFARPSSLIEAFALARAYEARAKEAKQGYRFLTKWNNTAPTPTTNSPSHKFQPQPYPLASTQPNHSAGMVRVPSHSQNTPPPPKLNTLPPLLPTPNLPIRRLTPAELRDKREKGLCYNCDQKYSANHRCRSKFLLLMGTDDNEPTSFEQELPPESVEEVITGDISSLNALAGQINPCSLRLIGEVGSHSFQVLIDSGSTHNFIKPTMAERMGLPIQPTTPFRVYIGNGDFLQLLGRVSHDYSALSMEFCWNGAPVTLQGDLATTPSLITFNQLQSLVHHTDIYSVFALQQVPAFGEESANPQKIKAMVYWPTPQTTKQLRAEAFDALKKAMVEAPVLRLPDFDADFILETDASNVGIGAVLMQSGHPISYFNKKLGPRLCASSTYIKELTAIVEAVHKWRQYLLGRFFVIRIDHKSIKELLQQVVQSPDQQIYIRKLLGYHFRIEYKPGCTNLAADALSRVHEEAGADTSTVTASCLPLLSRPSFELLATLNLENSTLSDMIALHQQFAAGTLSRDYSLHNGFLFYHNRYYINPSSSLKEVLLAEFHSSPLAGHVGIKRTLVRLAFTFFWPKMCMDVERTTYHPQTNGQSEVANRGLEQYLRAFTQEKPSSWVSLLGREAQFAVGDQVLVKLQPYRQNTVATRSCQKLAKRYYGLFHVLARVGPVAYKLDLPSVCAIRTVLKQGKQCRQVLVQWQDNSPENSTWEEFETFCKLYPDFHLEDKVSFEDGGNDTTFHIHSDQPDYLQEGQPNNESNYEQPMKEATSQVEEESAHEERYASTRVRRAPGWFKDYVV